MPRLNPPFPGEEDEASAKKASAAALESGDVALPSVAFTASDSGTNCPAKNLVHRGKKKEEREGRRG